LSDTPTYETAFVIYLDNNGNYFATTDIGRPFQAKREATRTDVSRACRELYDKIALEDLAIAVEYQLRGPESPEV
jgi:hypothetical protein